MATNLYLLGASGDLVGLDEAAYEAESVLQGLIADHPELIPGDQVSPTDPRRWVLVAREAALGAEAGDAGRWSVDHLFLDQEGVPTLVEVKRSTDTRIRREVVGQMLEYAANAGSYWSVATMRESFVATQGSEDAAEAALASLLNAEDLDTEGYWESVGENIARGRLRLIFLADKIPGELLRIIEFLNSAMERVDVFGVEVRRYRGASGEVLLNPRLLGQTQAKEDRRARGRGKRWDEESLLAAFEPSSGRTARDVAVRVLDWIRAHDPPLKPWFGSGLHTGWVYPVLDAGTDTFAPFALSTTGWMEIQFQHMRVAPFRDEVGRAQILDRLNAIEAVEVEARLTKRPGFRLEALAETDNLEAFLGVFDWAFGRVLDEAHGKPTI